MRKFLFTAILSLYALAGLAQLNGNGYYRLQNMGSERFAYVRDNRGSVSVGATAADLAAIQLWKNSNLSLFDPSSIIYIKSVGGNNYRFHSQGTNSYTIVGYDLKITEFNKKGKIFYQAYQTNSGMASYLCDAEISDADRGKLGTNEVPKNYKNWYVHKVDATSANFFGIKPTITIGIDHYAPFYAEFPFSFASPGMSAFYIKKVESGMAVLEEINDKVIPAGIPVIIKCASENVADNKINLLENATVLPKNNLLKGVYFCNLHGTESYHGNHWNAKEYNAKTMRVLAVSEDGKLAFKSDADLKYLPANQAYLPVAANTAEELVVVTQKEFDDIIASGIDAVISQDMVDDAIYNMSGLVVGHGQKALKQLPGGVYIMAGMKYIVR